MEQPSPSGSKDLTVNPLILSEAMSPEMSATMKGRSVEEMSKELFAEFNPGTDYKKKFPSTIEVSDRFVARPIYNSDILSQLTSLGFRKILHFIESIHDDDLVFIQSLANVWTYYYSALIPKIELIFRNLTEVRISNQLILHFRDILHDASRVKSVFESISHASTFSKLPDDAANQLKHMLVLAIVASREEDFPMNEKGHYIFTLYQMLFGSEPSLLQ